MPDAIDIQIQELDRAGAWIPREVEQAVAAARANAAGMGIHKTQLDALDVLMTSLTDKFQSELAAASAAPDATARSAALARCSTELVGRAEVWQVFRSALALRRDPLLKPVLDAGDLVAARAYHQLQERAVKWGALSNLRAPPLVVPRAASGVAAAGIGMELKFLTDAGFLLRRFRDLPLPLPIVLLPLEYGQSIWRFVGLFHEVGHLFDRDLGLSDELDVWMRPALPHDVHDNVSRWCREIVGDAIGVALGGAAFVISLTRELVALAPGALDLRETVHPNPHVRVPLVLALAKELEISVRQAALDELTLTKPPWLATYEPAIPAIARLFAKQNLKALKGHSLSELARDLASEGSAITALTDYLAKPGARSPIPLQQRNPHIAHDHVAIAAALAREVEAAASWDTIHEDALAYVTQAIPRPLLLDAPALGSPTAYWRGLSETLWEKERAT